MKNTASKFIKRGVLARSVALLFINSDVIPPEHKHLAKDDLARLRPVFALAFAHLRQTRAPLGKWLLFVLVGIYVATAYAVLIGSVLLLISSVAHAQTTSTSMFQPPNVQQDLAQNWINYLFFGQDISSYVSPSGQTIPQATNIQTALITAFSMYSNAILVVAAIVLFYHLAAMIVETAHHGVPMGKRASQIWAPIRLVVAIGLLVPINGGLNCGQYIVIKVAEMGSGLASQVWQTFLTALAKQGPTYHAPQTPYVRKVVQDLVAMEACRLTYNYYTATTLGVIGADMSAALIQPTAQPTEVDPISGAVISTSNATLYTNRTLGDQGTCGSYEIGTVPKSSGDANNFENQIPAAIAQAHITTIQNLLSSGQVTAVAKNVKYFIPSFNVTPDMPATTNGFSAGDNFPAGGTAIPSNAAYEALVTSYQNSLKSALNGAMGNLYDNGLQNLATQWSAQGWVSAGAWFNTIARSQGAIIDAAQDGLPKTQGPKVASMSMPSDGFSRAALWMGGQLKNNEQAYNLAQLTAGALSNFNVWADNTAVPSGSSNTSSQDAQKVMQQKMKDAAAGESDSSGMNLMNILFKGVDAIAVATGAWSGGPLAFSFTNTANPLAELAYLGHSFVSTGLNLFAFAGISSFLTWIPVAGKAFAFLAGIMVFIATVFLAGGFTLAFLVPLLPFIWFFFNVLTWVLQVLEAVVLMPMFALAHLNPEGEGLPGASARNAYFLILNIFLRPALMVFGLVCGLMLFFVAISFLNMMFTIAVAGTGVASGGFGTISKLVYSIIYVGLAYICANHSFKAIGYFPEHALKWIGASGHHESMGTPDHMGAIMSGVAAYGGQQLGQALQKPGQAVSQIMKSRQESQKAEAQAAIAKQIAGEKEQKADAQHATAQQQAETRHIQSLAHGAGVGVKDFVSDPANQQYFDRNLPESKRLEGQIGPGVKDQDSGSKSDT